MENLIQVSADEYTDIKNNRHKVSHFLLSDETGNDRERIIEELFHALERPGNRAQAQ